jgi:hypothetical protein
MSEPLPWNVCVVSHLPDLPHCGELANALLYGEKVLWLPAELPHHLPAHFRVFGLKVKLDLKLRSSPYVQGRSDEELARRREGYQELFRQLGSAGLNVTIPPSFMPQTVLREWADHVERLVPAREYTPGGIEWLLQPLLRGVFGSIKYSALTMRLLSALDERRPAEVRHYLEDHQIHGCILERGSPYSLQPPSGWATHRSAQLLMTALSRLLLPDVSQLPLLAVAELKEQVKPYLDPMRADMLRLTKQLRTMVEQGHSQEEITREAENLIATEVEPVVRESARYTADVMQSRWKTFLQGALRFLGFCGLGFLNPAAFGKEAASSGIEVLEQLPGVVGEVEPPTHAARFVLAVQRQLDAAVADPGSAGE